MILDPTQQRAVEMAIAERVSVITGGPGTGKTTIVRTVLEQLGGDVALCAPTGKAARRLEEQTGRPASTIHRLLAFNPVLDRFTYDRRNPLPHETMIVDEASMVDVELGAALLDAVSDAARIVFVGDADQLPSVGPGNLLRDLIASGQIPVTRLDTIHRQRAESLIPHNAAAINAGQQPETGRDFLFDELEAPADVAARVVELISEVIPREHRVAASDVQLLCPQRGGPVGVNALNERLQLVVNPEREGDRQWKTQRGVLREGDRVMHIKNNYRLEVMNGEIGTVDAIVDDALFVDFGDRSVEYGRAAAGELVLCYATTIHKSQGSEYPVVVVVVHSANSYMLSRALLYTAVTRGKQLVWLVGNRKGLTRAVRNADSGRRYSGLAAKLQEANAR